MKSDRISRATEMKSLLHNVRKRTNTKPNYFVKKLISESAASTEKMGYDVTVYPPSAECELD